MAASGFIWGDTYDYYATANLYEKWTNASNTSGGAAQFSISALAARNGGRGMRYISSGDPNNIDVIRKTLAPGDPTTFIGRTAFRYTAAQSVYTLGFMGCFDNATCQVCLAVQANGKIAAIRGAAIGNVLGTSTIALLVNVFYHIKMKVVVHPSAGSVQVWVNGLSVLSLSGINTRSSVNSTWDTYCQGKVGITGQGLNVNDAFEYHYDDTNVIDVDDGRFDLIAIALHAQTGNGAHTDFTPQTGTNHGDMVKDAFEDGDATYNQATAVNQFDTYLIENLPTPATIAFIQTVEVCRKTDAGDRVCANGLRIGGTDYVSAAVYAPSQVYFHCTTPYNVSPATGVVFTDTEINAMESGQKVTV